MSCNTELIENVYRTWPNFDPHVATTFSDHIPDVGVFRIGFLVGYPPKPDGEIVRSAALSFERLLNRSGIYADGYKPNLFLTDRILQPNNRIVRYKKLWRSASQFYDLAGLTTGDELLIECPNGIRFAGTAAISPSSFEKAFHLVSSTYYSAFILITKTEDFLSEESAREMYELSFPEPHDQSKRQNHFSIANVCLFSCLRGEIIVTCGFETDHSVWLLDIFANSSMLARLEQFKGSLDLTGKN